jgi:hypothetical protein
MKGVNVRHTLSRWTIDRARRSGFVLAFASFAALAACGSDSSTGPSGTDPTPTTPVGSYTITTVNGKGLPVALFAEASYTYEVTNGTLALTNDGKYSVITTFRQTLPGSVSTFVDSTGGTWVKTGTNIQLTNTQDGSLDTATWDKGILTFVEVDGKVTTTYVYGLKK